MYMYIYKHIHLLRLGKKLADGILMETLGLLSFPGCCAMKKIGLLRIVYILNVFKYSKEEETDIILVL